MEIRHSYPGCNPDDYLGNSNASVLVKRKRENEEKEKGLEQEGIISNNPESDLLPAPEKKRRETLSQRIGEFKDSALSLVQAKKYQNLLRRIQELQKIALNFQKFHTSTAIDEVKKEWAELGEDPIAWEKKIFEGGIDPLHGISSQVRISKQFKLIIHSELRNNHFRQLQIIFDIFITHNPSIEPKALKRIIDCTSIFEQVVTLSVKGTLIHIPKSCLLGCNSSYFNSLLNSNFFSDSNINIKPLELNIDEKNYQILDSWLREPSCRPFCNMKVNEILEFIIAVCPFDIPSLVTACDASLSRRITGESVFSFLEQIYQFQKESKRCGMKFLFHHVERKLIEILRYQNLSIVHCSSNHANWFLGAETEIGITIKDQSNLDGTLSKLQDVSIFKEVIGIHLDIVALSKLNPRQRDGLISCFPNIKTINIDFKYKNFKSKPTPTIIWKFLTAFEKLNKVVIHLPKTLDDDFFVSFNKFPNKKEWQIFFNINQYFCKDFLDGTPLSADHFIRLKFLESLPTTFHEWPIRLKHEIKNYHIQELIDAKKFDFESTLLDLSDMEISQKVLNQIVRSMTKLEELKFNRNFPYLLPLVNSLPLAAPLLRKLTLPLSFFQNNEALICLKNSIQKGQCKDLLILVDSFKKNPVIRPQLIRLLRKYLSVQVKFQSPEGVSLTLLQHSLKIELENHHLHRKINEDEQSRRHLTSFARVLQDFSGLPIILNVKGINIPAQTLIGLSQAFPYLSELQVGCRDFDPKALKGFYQLKTLLFSSSDFLKRFSYLEDLQNYPVDIVIDNLESESQLWVEFIRKLIGIRDLLTNFQPLRCLTQEQQASLTDRELLALIPRKCHSVLDFSGMHQISSQAVLEILKTFPAFHRLLHIANCQRIQKEICEGQLPLEDFILLITLADQNHGSDLFTKQRFYHYRKQLTAQHIDKLLNAKKIPPSSFLFLADMSLMGTAAFLRLLKEVNPTLLVMSNTPNLYSALKFGASYIQKHITLPFEVLKEKDFLKSFLENYLMTNVLKQIHIQFELSDLEFIDENMIFELSQNELDTVFISPEIQIKFNPKHFIITFKDCKTDHTLSEKSLCLPSLSKLTSNLSKIINLQFPINFNSSERLSLGTIIHHFSNLKQLDLSLSFNEEMLKNQKNLEPLVQCANLKTLFLHGDEKLLPHTPALALLQNLPQRIIVENQELRSIQDLETFVNKLEFLKVLFPKHHALTLIPLSKQIRAQFTDEVLLKFKPVKDIDGWDFSEMSQITLEGVLKYLEGIHFTSLNFRGCNKIISTGGVEVIQSLYPEAIIRK